MPRFIRGILIGLLVLTSGTVAKQWIFPDLVACAGRVPLKVVTSTEKIDVLNDLKRDYNKANRPKGATCAEVSIVPVSSGIAEEILAGDPKDDPVITEPDRKAVAGAQVWLPSAGFWLDRLERDSKDDTAIRRIKAHSLARSPLVLAMPASLRKELKWDIQPPTWRGAMDLLRAGQLNYTQENPRTSTSGAMATYLTFAAGAVGGDGAPAPSTLNASLVSQLGAFVSGVQAAAKGGFQNDSTDILRLWSQPGLMPNRTMIMIQEQMVRGFNTGVYSKLDGRDPDVQLVAVHPVTASGERTSLVAEHPYVTLPRVSAAEEAAAEDFRVYVMAHWDALCEAGFQAPADSPAADCAAAKTLAGDVRALFLPDSDVQAQMVDLWRGLRSTRRITIAMDVSGSMKDERVLEAAQAVREGVKSLRPGDQVEIFRFAGTVDYTRQYWRMRELKDVGPNPGNDPAFGRLSKPPAAASARMTAVYPTVDALYRAVSARHRADGLNALDVLIVLSDGIQDWNDTRTPTSVCNGWKGLTPVPVYTIHYDPAGNLYGSEKIAAGAAALETFAACSGTSGAASQSTDEAPLRAVFSRVMGSL